MGQSTPCDFCPVPKAQATQQLPTAAVLYHRGKHYDLRISQFDNGDGTPLFLHFLRELITPTHHESDNSETQPWRRIGHANGSAHGIEALIGG